MTLIVDQNHVCLMIKKLVIKLYDFIILFFYKIFIIFNMKVDRLIIIIKLRRNYK